MMHPTKQHLLNTVEEAQNRIMDTVRTYGVTDDSREWIDHCNAELAIKLAWYLIHGGEPKKVEFYWKKFEQRMGAR